MENGHTFYPVQSRYSPENGHITGLPPIDNTRKSFPGKFEFTTLRAISSKYDEYTRSMLNLTITTINPLAAGQDYIRVFFCFFISTLNTSFLTIFQIIKLHFVKSE